jgi:hypothetical protein
MTDELLRKKLATQLTKIAYVQRDVEEADQPARNFKRTKLLGTASTMQKRLEELLELPVADDVLCNPSSTHLWLRGQGWEPEVKKFGPWHIAILRSITVPEAGIIRGRACKTEPFAMISAFLKLFETEVLQKQAELKKL